MVDLLTGQTVMRTKKKARKYIEPDAFHLARHKAGLTMKQAALELDVDVRTIRNYENGVSRIPYPAFRLLRLLANYQLVGRDWADWSFWQNKLWSPEGRSFAVHELRYVATYISLARHFLKTQAVASLQRSSEAAAKTIEKPPAVRGVPSSATALFGAEVRQVNAVDLEASPGLQEKAA